MLLRGRIVPFIAIVSLVACVVTLGTWARSEWVTEGLIFYRRDEPAARPYHYGGTYLNSEDGGVILRRMTFWTTDPVQIAKVRSAIPPRYAAGRSTGEIRRRVTLTDYLGFEWPEVRTGAPGQTAKFWQARVPYGFVAMMLAVSPAVWLARRAPWRERRRLAAGLCPACGYDLRGTPHRCPECGFDKPEDLTAEATMPRWD